MMKHMTFCAGIVLVFICVLFVNGCALDKKTAQTRLSEDQVERICMMPFLLGMYRGNLNEKIDATFTCTLDKFCLDPEDVKDGADEFLTRQVHERLLNRFGRSVVSMKEAEKVYEEIAIDLSNETPRSLAKRMGEKVNANLVMVGTVWRYKERIGGTMAMESPASVAFSLYLLDVSSGERLWTATFNKTQQSFMLNALDAPLFFKYGFKWLSADQLAKYGVEKVFKTFPF